MDDLDDIVEGLDDIEDIAEEVFDPEDLIEDFVRSPVTVALALVAVGAALFTVLMLAVVAILALLAFGLWPLVLALVVAGFLVTLLAVAGFLYVRTDVPHRIQRQIDEARSQVDGSKERSTGLTEQEAIDRLQEAYAAGEINEPELEAGLEEIIERDDPEHVVRERVPERER